MKFRIEMYALMTLLLDRTAEFPWSDLACKLCPMFIEIKVSYTLCKKMMSFWGRLVGPK
jgi:hypothetical protein